MYSQWPYAFHQNETNKIKHNDTQIRIQIIWLGTITTRLRDPFSLDRGSFDLGIALASQS